MKLLNFFLALCLCHPRAFAGQDKVLVRAADADVVDFRAHLEAYGEHQPYSEWWIRNRVAKESTDKLKRLLTLAQSEFLQGGLVEAQQKFLDVVAMAFSQDWRAAERATFVYAYLRLAQMAADQESRSRMIQEAARWGTVEIKAELFPAPLWLEYKKAKASRLSEALDLDLWFPQARYLLVDGRPIEVLAGTKFETDAHPHRFTLVYDHALPESRIASWTELKAWQPNLKNLAQGSCLEPLWISTSLPADSAAYFAEGCVLNWKATPAVGTASTSARIDSTSWPKDLTNVSGIKASNTSAKWWWIGGGLVLTAVAVSLSQERERKTESSTTIGF
ncbi:MAG: hypothetical protein AB7N80_00425 [Bdellovibrionales bacterium]